MSIKLNKQKTSFVDINGKPIFNFYWIGLYTYGSILQDETNLSFRSIGGFIGNKNSLKINEPDTSESYLSLKSLPRVINFIKEMRETIDDGDFNLEDANINHTTYKNSNHKEQIFLLYVNKQLIVNELKEVYKLSLA
jgi:hypothetical protein